MARPADDKDQKPRGGDRPPLPSQKELFLACLRPGTHVDLVIRRDEDEESVEARGSMLHDISRDRKIILAQTSPPLNRSFIGQYLEVTFLVRLDDVPGGRLLRVGYATKLLEVIPDYQLGANLSEPVLVVDLPPRLDETSLRMHFRVVPPLELGLKAFVGASTLRNVIEAEAGQFDRLVRSELWNREKHPKLVIRDLTEAVRQLVERVSRRVEDVKQAEVADISEGGLRLVHPTGWDLADQARLDLTLVWGDDTLDLEANVVRTGQVEIRGSRAKNFACLRLANPPVEVRRKLSKLVNGILRKELAKRAEEDL